MKKEESRELVRIKTYSTKELAALYEVSEKTFRSWIAPFKGEVGKKIGRFYYPRQVRIIFEKLEVPGGISLNNEGLDNKYPQ